MNVGMRKYAPEIAMARFLCIFCAWNFAEARNFMHVGAVSAGVLKRDKRSRTRRDPAIPAI